MFMLNKRLQGTPVYTTYLQAQHHPKMMKDESANPRS